MAVIRNNEKGTLAYEDLGVTMRTLMGHGATGFQECQRRSWTLVYRGVTVGKIQVKDDLVKPKRARRDTSAKSKESVQQGHERRTGQDAADVGQAGSGTQGPRKAEGCATAGASAGTGAEAVPGTDFGKHATDSWLNPGADTGLTRPTIPGRDPYLDWISDRNDGGNNAS